MPKLLIANDVQENATITLKGFKDNVYELPTAFSTYIDLTNASIGSNMYDVYLVGDIDYTKMNITVNPSKIPVILDELAYKTVPIEPSTTGMTSLGLDIDNIIINPSNTIISGPKTLISAIDSVKTYPKNVKSDVSRVNVSIIFNKDVEVVEFNNIIVSFDNLDSRFAVNSAEGFIVNKVVLEANRSFLTNITANDILLSLDLKDITNTGKYSNISVEANIPMNTKLIKIEPSYFDIEISAKNDTTNNNK